MKKMILMAPQPAMLLLAQIVELYTEAAYPPGGSECAQSARESLQNVATQLRTDYDELQQCVAISRRIKAHVKSAIQYYAESGAPEQKQTQQAELLTRCLQGDNLNDMDWPD